MGAIFTHSNPSGLLGGRNHGFCGNNKNQHLYIPCGEHDKINIMTTISKKSQDNPHEYMSDKHWFEKNSKWNIKITQIPCSSDDKYFCELEAPKGCLQYYFKEHGQLKSFNYDEQARLGFNQDYAICIKTVGGHHGLKACSITYKASQFNMPVGGNDVGYCESGVDIVNELTNHECCVDPKSSYLAFVGKQSMYKKYKKYEKEEKNEKKEETEEEKEAEEKHEKYETEYEEHEKHEKTKEHEQHEKEELDESEKEEISPEEDEEMRMMRHVKYDRKHKEEEYEKDKKKDHSKEGSTRRYWCGKSLGPINEVLSSPKLAILKVFSGKKSEEKLDYPASGFVIDYKIETGYC